MRFDGVHEVLVKTPTGTKWGCFDDYDKALAAVENEPSEHRAAWFSLNPLNVLGLEVNPVRLIPHKRADKADIALRVHLLLDFDPPRPADTSSTDAEKKAASEEMLNCREYLTSRGWPRPLVGDSGNGWHLVYNIDLPNDDESELLVKSVLSRLKELFPMLDAGNVEANRLCKLYGTWARKGQHSDERPWRRSAIIEEGNGIVTAEQLRVLAPVVLPETRAIVAGRPNDVKLADLVGMLDYYSVGMRSQPREITGGWQIEIECPWADEHSSENPRDSVVSFIAGQGNGFKCFHSHCAGKRWADFRAELERQNPGLAPYFKRLPLMTHSDIARDFVRTHDDFVSVYDRENETAVWMPGVRWRLGDPKDSALRSAIRQHLDMLFERYPTPEDGKRDCRLALKQAPFTNGVLSEARPLLPPKSEADFDANPDILPLPYGKVADLRTGIIRSMRREDCQTKRLNIFPVETPTPLWDGFLREVMGDAEMAAYIERLMSLSVTGRSPHLMLFFYGGGRNGKGAILRFLEKILRGDVFVANLKKDDLDEKRGDDHIKRLNAKLRGKRLAFNGEAATGKLDVALLKSLTGGDTLSGARLYKDEASFRPTHTLFVLTNERPMLESTTAIKGRLRFIPFNVSFAGREDPTLEDRLEADLPGVLARLIKLAPDVIEHGDQPPASVLEATNDLLDENDVSRPFIEECLIADADAVTPLPDMTAAIARWGRGDVDRVMAGVRLRWPYKAKKRAGKVIRGLIGVRVASGSSER